MMIEKTEYVFNDKRDIVAYLYKSLSDPTPIKLQKSLYFLWAFYAATYGNIDYDSKSEFQSEKRYPNYLFKPDFEAWKYGPVDNEVYRWDKQNEIKDFDNNFDTENDSQKHQIKLFMDDLISQIDSVNDFGLVNRSHEDKAYQEAYEENTEHIPMNPEFIKRDYIEYVKKQSEI